MQSHRIIAATLALFAISLGASGDRIKNLCEIQGARGNELKGVGLVVGLAGTGDSVLEARRAQERILRRLGVEVPTLSTIAPDNVAVVMITATMPPYAKEGTRIDVQVNSIFDAESLEGGTLMETLLEGIDGEVYSVAQGAVSVGGFNADAGGGTGVRNNHVTAGRVPMGAYVEREIPSTVTDGERIMLLLKRPDFNTAVNIQKALDAAFGDNTATAYGGGTIGVRIPVTRQQDLVGFIAEVNDVNVTVDLPARIVINERTGTIVVGDEVMVKPCQVAHGGLTIRVQAFNEVSQPGAFAGGGETVEFQNNAVDVSEPTAHLFPVQGVSASEVAEALNRLRVTPRDMITIFQALREAGVLDADLEIM